MYALIFFITAIALSLKESESKSQVKTSSLYPTTMDASSIYATSSKPREVRKVRIYSKASMIM